VLGEHRIFHTSLDGSSALNDAWLERKFRVVRHYERSSLAVRAQYRADGEEFETNSLLDPMLYAAAGGAVPLRVHGSFVGAVARQRPRDARGSRSRHPPSAVPSALAARQQVSGEAVRIALIGSGKMASVHARNITAEPDAELVAVAGGSGAAALADRHGARTMTVDEAMRSGDVDAVVIASPNPVHVEHILAAAAGGKAALVEKPVDLDLARVDECIRTVGAAADRIVVAFNRRYDPSFAAMRKQVQERRIGDLQQLTIVSRDPAPPPLDYVPASGGIFRDMTIHDFDMARHVAGEIVAVQAAPQSLHSGIAALDDFSGAVVTLTARSGALVAIINSRSNSTGYDQRLEAFGTTGVISVSNPSTTLVRRSDSAAADAADPYVSHYGARYAEAYRAEIAHLVDVCRGDARPRSSLADGRAALALADAAHASARSGERILIA
jgi:myo-inositol 2-dehydrogenase/D-chiro-inositol 1-dehydrogenase